MKNPRKESALLTPVYTKSPYEPQWEYHHMTWEIFLATREWAQEVAVAEHAHVYLVGSTLWKPYSRDLDVSIVLERAAFEAQFGPLPTDPAQLARYLTQWPYEAAGGRYGIPLAERIWYSKRVDCKVQPEGWFMDRDRLLLATPTPAVRRRMGSLPERQKEEAPSAPDLSPLRPSSPKGDA